jgi:hypothetical protein
MEALLRLAAMCLLNLASLLGMRPSRHVRECHTDATPQALPLKDRDPSTKETNPAAQTSSETTPALMLISARSARPSKHEGALTARRHKLVETLQDSLDLPPLISTKVGTQGRRKACSELRLQLEGRTSLLFCPGSRLSPG